MEKSINVIYMKKIILKISFVSVLCFASLAFGSSVLASTTASIQTNSATNIQNNSATLNGNLTDLGSSTSPSVYFQWGTSAGNYTNQTTQQTQNTTGTFSQTITGLVPNTTYHFQSVAINHYGPSYGQDMTFYTGSSQTSSSTLTANAGSDLYLTSGQTSTLQGSGYDPNGYTLNYSWNCTGGTLSNYNIAQPIYTAPYAINGNNQTTYTCTLTVTNNYGNSNSDSTTIYINSNNNNSGSNYVQTSFATFISSNGATLNGNIPNNNNYNNVSNTVYFQWGTSSGNYPNQTSQQILSTGSFLQAVGNLNPNTTYHFRAVSQGSNGAVYGQDLSFTTLGGNGIYSGSGGLTVRKQVLNITSGNLNWQASVNANPGDILSFAIVMQATGGQDIHNVLVTDNLPANLIYTGSMMINASANNSGNPTSGVNIGTIAAGDIVIVTYHAQVSAATGSAYGTTNLSNNATVTSTEGGTQTASASVIINTSTIQGATNISTGLTNNPVRDSFFLPVFLIILGSWLYFSGNVYAFADWLGKYL